MSVATTSWKYEPFDSCVWKRNEAMTVLPAANLQRARLPTAVKIIKRLFMTDGRLTDFSLLFVVVFLSFDGCFIFVKFEVLLVLMDVLIVDGCSVIQLCLGECQRHSLHPLVACLVRTLLA